MDVINMHDAKSRLSQLAHRAAAGETIIIGTAGKPLARLGPLESADHQPASRFDFMTFESPIPDDFDEMEAASISTAFEGR